MKSPEQMVLRDIDKRQGIRLSLGVGTASASPAHPLPADRLPMGVLCFMTPKRYWVYVMRSGTMPPAYKIGITSNVGSRRQSIGLLLPFSLALVCYAKYKDRDEAQFIENGFHKSFENQKINGEWFNLTERNIESLKMAMGLPYDNEEGHHPGISPEQENAEEQMWAEEELE